MASAGGSCQEMEPAGDFAARARHRPDALRNEQSSPARSALSCHPPEMRLHPCTARERCLQARRCRLTRDPKSVFAIRVAVA
jgi:hypothetical protein